MLNDASHGQTDRNTFFVSSRMRLCCWSWPSDCRVCCSRRSLSLKQTRTCWVFQQWYCAVALGKQNGIASLCSRYKTSRSSINELIVLAFTPSPQYIHHVLSVTISLAEKRNIAEFSRAPITYRSCNSLMSFFAFRYFSSICSNSFLVCSYKS